MKYFKFIICIIIFSLLISRAVSGAEIKRDILAVIDGDEMEAETFNLIASFAETPLNHLGFRVSYVDVSKRLPDEKEMAKYHGIISWFWDNKIKGSENYAKWITAQLNRGKKLVVMENPGFLTDQNENLTPPDVLDQFYRAFSISFNPDDNVESPFLIELLYKDPKMTEFERSLTGELTYFVQLSALDKGANIYLKLKRKDTGANCDAVFVHSKGGFVVKDYAAYINPENFEARWRIDPFKFFARAFGSDFPKPDISTMNGVRTYMSHIDGDGIRNISDIDGKTPSIKILYDRFLTKYNLPVSISVLIGDLIAADEEERLLLTDLIKKIYALPNTEAASHGWAHPMYWDKPRRKMAYDIRNYVYSPANEIGWSLKYINDYLVPPEKKTNLFFWTGNCRPDYEALKYVYENNIENINGGDTRLDSAYPSYIYVAPLFRNVDGLLQNFAADANEVVYTNIWTGPFYGFKYVIDTYKNTESPFRIRPIDLYYHFYLMDRRVAVDSLKEIHEWLMTQELAPIFVSDYLDRLKGFLNMKIEKAAPDRFIVTDNGALKTVRMDNYDGFVDLENSKGVMGFLPYQGSLYIHLEGADRSEIRLTKRRPTRPYLEKANGEVEGFAVSKGGASFKLRTMGKVIFSLAGMKTGQRYTAAVLGKTYPMNADSQGRIDFSEDILKNRFAWVDVVVKEG